MKQLLKREAEAQSQSQKQTHESKNGEATEGDDSSWFADALVEHAGSSLVAWTGSNRGAFVVAALEEVPSAKKAVGKLLKTKAAREKLVQLAKEGASMGAKVSRE